VIVTSRSHTRDFDFISRFFSPAQGLAEDYVTGSAHCSLDPYWKNKLHQTDFIACQASERGGIVKSFGRQSFALRKSGHHSYGQFERLILRSV